MLLCYFTLCAAYGRLKMTKHPFSGAHKSLLPRTTDDKECKEFDEEMQCFSAGL